MLMIWGEIGKGQKKRCRVNFYDVPVFAVLVVLQLVLNHAHHDFVGYESSGIHDLLRLDTQGCLLGDLLTEHVPRRQVAYTELVANSGRLCSLALK